MFRNKKKPKNSLQSKKSIVDKKDQTKNKNNYF